MSLMDLLMIVMQLNRVDHVAQAPVSMPVVSEHAANQIQPDEVIWDIQPVTGYGRFQNQQIAE